MRANRLPAAVALTVLAMAGASACSSGDRSDSAAANGLAGLSGAEIVAKAKGAANRATSVRLAVRVDQKEARAVMTIATARGGDCSQEMTEGDPLLDGGSRPPAWIHTLRKDGQSFVKTERSRSPISGQWTSDDNEQSDMFDSCDMAFKLTDQLDTVTVGDKRGQWLHEGTTRIDGVPAVVLRYRTGSVADDLALTPKKGMEVRIAVAAEGEPYLLRMETGTGENRTTLLLSAYNAPVTVTAPPASEVYHYDSSVLPD